MDRSNGDSEVLKIVESWEWGMGTSIEKLRRIAVLAQLRKQARAQRAEGDSSNIAEEGEEDALDLNSLRMG